MNLSMPCISHEDTNNRIASLLESNSLHDSVGLNLGHSYNSAIHNGRPDDNVFDCSAAEGVGGFGGCEMPVSFADGRSLLSVSCVQGSLDLVQWVLNSEYDEGSRDFCGWTPMHVAAFEGRLEVCRALLRAGLSVNDTDDEGRSPLICAAQEGHLDIVKFLMGSGASIDHIAANSGQNALRVAALEAHSVVVAYLLESGSNINLRDKDGRTTLYVLAQEDKLEMGQLFMEWRADVHLKDFDGRSPLMVAAWQGHFEMCQFLIQHGADINCVDIESRSVLQMAAWQGHTSIIRLLCECGVDINSMCSQGATALTIAAQEGHTDVIECLLQFGADPLIQDKHGRSAYKMAMLSRNSEVKDLMERAVEVNNGSRVTIENNNNNNNNLNKISKSMRSDTPPNINERDSAMSPQLTRINSFLSQKPSAVEFSSALRLSSKSQNSPSPPAIPRREAPLPPPTENGHSDHAIHGVGASPDLDLVHSRSAEMSNIRQVVVSSNSHHQIGTIDGNRSDHSKVTASLSSESPFSSLDNSTGEKDTMKEKFEQLRVTSEAKSTQLLSRSLETGNLFSIMGLGGHCGAMNDAEGRQSVEIGTPITNTSHNILHHHQQQQQPLQHDYPNLASFSSTSLSQIPNHQPAFHQLTQNNNSQQLSNYQPALLQQPSTPLHSHHRHLHHTQLQPRPESVPINMIATSHSHYVNNSPQLSDTRVSNEATPAVPKGQSVGTKKPDNPMYIDVRQLQKSILMQARKQELEDRERKNKKRRKRNLFAKIHGLLSFSKSSSKTSEEADKAGTKTNGASVLSDDEFSVSAFANSNCNTPRADQFTNVNQFSFASPNVSRKSDSKIGDFTRSNQKRPVSTDNTISDKKSADYRRLVDLSHMKNVDPLTSRSFRNYDRLGAIKAARAKQQQSAGAHRNYVPLTFQSGNQPNFHNIQPSMLPGNQAMALSSVRAANQPILPASNSKKSYYISLAEIKKAPSRKPPEVPEDASKWFQPRSSKPPEVPLRNPRQLANVFEHVNGMSKVVAQAQLPGQFVPNFSDLQGGLYIQSSKGIPGSNLQQQMRTTSNSGVGALRNYVNQHEMAHRFQSRLMNTRMLETIEEPTGLTLESKDSLES